jgi:hypothetical protein
MNVYIKLADAFLGADCLTFKELLSKTGLSRRTLSKALNELVTKGFLGKVVLSRKRVYYVCIDPYNLDLMMRWEWHEFGRPSREEYSGLKERRGMTVEEAEEINSFFAALAFSQPKAFLGVERDTVMLYLGRDNKIILDTEQFLREIEDSLGIAISNPELFTGKWVDASIASEHVKKKARLVEDDYTGEKRYFLPPLLTKMNLGRCLEAWSRAYGFLIGSKKDFERWGIEVKRDSVGYYFENPERVREIKDYFKKAYNEYSRKETINKISALAYLLWLNREKLRPYATNEPIVV